MGWGFRFAPYVSVDQKLAKGHKAALALAKKEKRSPQPVMPKGRNIAVNFWGKAWCKHLETMHDFDNRLDRGRRYLNNGSVVDLVMKTCQIKSLVAGSSAYTVTIQVKPLSPTVWERIKKDARKSVTSLIDLLAGKLDESVIRLLTDPKNGIFPKPDEFAFSCSCPDGAYVCKHVAAVFYGVGTLLDSKPELLFLIRDVDSTELVGLNAVASSMEESLNAKSSLGGTDLESMFGIELEKDSVQSAGDTPSKAQKKTPIRKKASSGKPGTPRKPEPKPGADHSESPTSGPKIAAKKIAPKAKAVAKASASETKKSTAKKSGANSAKTTKKPVTSSGKSKPPKKTG